MKINRSSVLFLASIVSLSFPSLYAETPKASTPVAKIGGTVLTEDDLRKDMGMNLFEAENQLYEVKKNWVDEKAKALIFNQTAKEAGLSLQAWQVKEIDAKISAPTKQDIDQWAPRFRVQGSTVPPNEKQY